ncbi:MAG TPA: hypothetical protein VMF31_02455 [Solirubrobacterales bacterium]|nr:hypothetical protein [Solirubrobacterales bacterium]
MALSEDSRTLLQLLLGRGKSYGDIASLLGIEESEVRNRAHQALTEIHGGDPDRDANLTDYLLGQSDPIGRADVARVLAENEAAAETAAELSDQLRLLVPGASFPRGGAAPARKPVPPSSAPRRARRVTPSTGDDQPSDFTSPLNKTLDAGQRRLIAILVFAALLIVVAVILIAKPFGDNDDSNEPAKPSPENAGALMQPVGDQKGTGKVQFGRVDDNFAANLQFSDLKPSTGNTSYLLWMSGSIGAFPLSEVAVGKTGDYSNTIVLAPEALCSISTGVFTDLTLSRVSEADSNRVIKNTQQALKGKQQKLPGVEGKVVFEGPVGLDPDLRKVVNQQCQTPASNQ